MQDEKLIESSLEAISNRVQELKESLMAFIGKLEHEQMSWPQVLDNFALLSALKDTNITQFRKVAELFEKSDVVVSHEELLLGQVSTLVKLLKHEKTPALRNLVLLPLLVQQEADPDLQKATDGRIQAFNHEVVPNYLRTKYAPEIEEEEQAMATIAQTMTPESVQKQISTLNDLASHLVDIVSTAKDEWEGELSSDSQSTSATNPDINTLVATVTFGKGLKPAKVSKRGSTHGRSSDATGKVPSSIKTEMKLATARSSHPYGSNKLNRPGSNTGT